MAMSRTVPKKDYGSNPVKAGVPLSFGSNFHDDPITRSTLRKAHALELNPQCDHDPHTHYEFTAGQGYSSFVRSSSTYGSTSRTNPLNSTGGSVNSVPMTGSLRSVKKEPSETILRFLGYIREIVPESPDETVRIRKVAIVYHVGDGSLLIREAQQVNSGMTQSIILKRQRVLVADAEGDDYVNETHLRIGNTLNLVGRVVTIVDMDEGTRRYFRDEHNIDVADPLPWPEDDTYNNTQRKKLSVNPKKTIPSADMENRRAMESAAGGAVSKHAPDDIRIAQQFFSNKINQSLQFAALWDDRDHISGDLRFVVIRYYLENDSVEVVEKRDENCGREGGNRLLNRQRISKPGGAPDPSQQQNTFGMLTKRGYYTMDDFALGEYITLHGRKFLVYDADSFTREWFLKNRSRDVGPARDITGIKMKGYKAPPVQYPPPHNGFGSEEDSMHAWKNLLRKPQRIDTDKLAREEGKVMLFSAKLANTNAPEDVGREFLVYFHRQTDEIEVVERQIRNAGIIGGKFLAKGRHRKTLPDGRKVLYEPSDFEVGRIVNIVGRDFELIELDERSRKLVAGEEAPVTEERVRELVVLLKNLLQWKFCSMHEAYRKIAPEGTLTAKELSAFYYCSAANITPTEAAQVVYYFAPTKNGVIPFEDFVRVMDIPNSNNLDEMSNNPRAVRGVNVDTSEEHQRTIVGAAVGAQRRARANQLKKMFVAKVVERRGTIQEVFRILAGHAPNSRMDKKEFNHGLIDVFHMDMPKDDMQILEELVFGDNEELTFKQFHLFVESGM